MRGGVGGRSDFVCICSRFSEVGGQTRKFLLEGKPNGKDFSRPENEAAKGCSLQPHFIGSEASGSLAVKASPVFEVSLLRKHPVCC